MTKQEDALEKAETYLRQGENAGIQYPTQQERQAAKMQLFEQFTREAKQEQIPDAAAASEGGSVIGAPAGGRGHEEIAAELASEQKKKATAESIGKRKALRAELDKALPPIQVQFTR